MGARALAISVRGYSRMMRDVVGMAAALLPELTSEWLRVAQDLRLDAHGSSGYGRRRAAMTAHGALELELGAQPSVPSSGFRGMCAVRRSDRGPQEPTQLDRGVRGTDVTLVLAGPQRRIRLAMSSGSRTRPQQTCQRASLGQSQRGGKGMAFRAGAGPRSPELDGDDRSFVARGSDGGLLDRHYAQWGHTRLTSGRMPTTATRRARVDREAVLRARARGPSDVLADRIRREFTWERAAVATHGAYRGVLEPS